MTPRTAAAIAALAAFAAVPACAQSRMAAGLWEFSTDVKGGDGTNDAMAQMQKQMQQMSPEQRKRVEQMMAQRGVSVDAAGGKTKVKVCLSKEQVARDEIPQADANGRCKQSTSQRNGPTLRFTFACAGDPPTKGEGEYTFDGDKAFSGWTKVDSVVDGKPEKIETKMNGRWLGADCGGLKPRG